MLAKSWAVRRLARRCAGAFVVCLFRVVSVSGGFRGFVLRASRWCNVASKPWQARPDAQFRVLRFVVDLCPGAAFDVTS
eukprot:202445-Alexandrium_andersonii.AAC.1